MRILVADDHPLVRDGIRIALRNLFPAAQIVEAGTSAEALDQAARLRPHLSLLDINLPESSGLELARRLRMMHPSTRILFLAGAADPWTVREAFLAGARGYVTKTNAAQNLRQAVRAVMAGETFLCDAAAQALQRAESSQTSAPEPPGLAVLSHREREVLQLIAQGQTTKAIALALQLSPKTVETHRQHLMRKLHLDHVADLTCYAIRQGLRTL